MPLNKGNPSDLTEVVTPEPWQEWAEERRGYTNGEGKQRRETWSEAVPRMPFQRGPEHVYRRPLSLFPKLLQRQGLCAVGSRWVGQGIAQLIT